MMEHLGYVCTILPLVFIFKSEIINNIFTLLRGIKWSHHDIFHNAWKGLFINLALTLMCNFSRRKWRYSVYSWLLLPHDKFAVLATITKWHASRDCEMRRGLPLWFYLNESLISWMRVRHIFYFEMHYMRLSINGILSSQLKQYFTGTDAALEMAQKWLHLLRLYDYIRDIDSVSIDL